MRLTCQTLQARRLVFCKHQTCIVSSLRYMVYLILPKEPSDTSLREFAMRRKTQSLCLHCWVSSMPSTICNASTSLKVTTLNMHYSKCTSHPFPRAIALKLWTVLAFTMHHAVLQISLNGFVQLCFIKRMINVGICCLRYGQISFHLRHRPDCTLPPANLEEFEEISMG